MATRLLEAAVMQFLYPDGPDSPDYDPWGDPIGALTGIQEHLWQWPDRAAARRAYGELCELIDAQRKGAQVRLPARVPPSWLADDSVDGSPS